MKKQFEAFTFVELIVVITIMAILSTIAFMTYQEYLSGARDSNRIVQMNDIYDGLERLSATSRLPFPEKSIDVVASGAIISYQGEAGENIMNTIGYQGGGKDPEFGNYLTYVLAPNARDFQLMTYIEKSNSLSISPKLFADYKSYFKILKGQKLGVIIDELSGESIHKNKTIQTQGYFDLLQNNTEAYALLQNNEIIPKEKLSFLIPNSSCKRIKEFGKSKGNGIYTVFSGTEEKVRVYCDMEMDGGGWTLVARSKIDSNYTGDFGWLSKVGNISDETHPYSLGPNVQNIFFNEILIGLNGSNNSVRKYSSSQDDVFLQHTPNNRVSLGKPGNDIYLAAKFSVNPLHINGLKSASTDLYGFSKVVPDRLLNTTNVLRYNNPDNIPDASTYDFLCHAANCSVLYWGNFPNTAGYNFGRASNQNMYLTTKKYEGGRNNRYDNVFVGEEGIVFVR